MGPESRWHGGRVREVRLWGGDLGVRANTSTLSPKVKKMAGGGWAAVTALWPGACAHTHTHTYAHAHTHTLADIHRMGRFSFSFRGGDGGSLHTLLHGDDEGVDAVLYHAQVPHIQHAQQRGRAV